MALVTTKEMFAKALKSDYAIGAFNVNNMEIIQGIVEAAKIERSPLILQVSAGARKYAKPAYLLKLVEAAILDTGLDIALHLDHGEDFEICKKCVDDGFTSVMIDGSKHPFEENIRITKEVVDYAHAHGVVVEAELGKLAGVEDNVKVDARSATFTDPDEAAEFVERTGVDSLAIAIGTSHGAYKFKGEPYLDFERLKTIHKLIPDTPLVLHGASSQLKTSDCCYILLLHSLPLMVALSSVLIVFAKVHIYIIYAKISDFFIFIFYIFLRLWIEDLA